MLRLGNVNNRGYNFVKSHFRDRTPPAERLGRVLPSVPLPYFASSLRPSPSAWRSIGGVISWPDPVVRASIRLLAFLLALSSALSCGVIPWLDPSPSLVLFIMSAMWDKDVTRIFCDLCIKEVELGNRPTTHFNKEGWDNIGKRFKELTGRDYDRLKFKNKWDQLKKEWKLWKDLKRGCTGLGWDPIRRTIDAPPEWWAEKLEAFPAAKKFKQCGIDPEMEEKMDIMFQWVVASGRLYGNPSNSNFSGIPEELTQEPLTPEEEGRSINQRETVDSSTGKRPRISKKNKEKQQVVNSSLDRLVEAFVAPPISDSDILGCLKVLRTIPEVVENKRFYAQCIKKLEDITRMKIFLALEPEMRLEYLKVLVNE